MSNAGGSERGETCPACGALPCDWVNDPRWQDIAAAPAVTGKEVSEGRGVRVLLYGNGRIQTGIVTDFTGDDGEVRRGTGAGFGIWLATHWMPLPSPPEAAC